MIQRGPKLLGAAAVAHVHAHYVHARSKGLVRRADHILRIARAFETVHDDKRRRRRVPLRLPVAMAQYLDILFYLEQALFGRAKCRSAGKKIPRQRHAMSAAEPAPRTKFILHLFW